MDFYPLELDFGPGWDYCWVAKMNFIVYSLQNGFRYLDYSYCYSQFLYADLILYVMASALKWAQESHVNFQEFVHICSHQHYRH